MRSRIGACVAIGVLLVTGWCRADEAEEEAAPEAKVYVGGGAVVKTQPYVGTDPRVYPVPLFAYESDRLYFRGLTGGYWLFSVDGVSVGPVLQPRLDGYKEDDSHELEGMENRDWSLDGGVAVNWVTKIGLIGVSFVTDLLGRHNGQELDFSDTALFKWAGYDFIPSAGVRWKSTNLVDYYYGVEEDEVRFDDITRRPYEGNDAVDPYLRLAVRRKVNDRWSLLGAVEYEWLADEITNSPIVEDDYEASFVLGLLYSW